MEEARKEKENLEDKLDEDFVEEDEEEIDEDFVEEDEDEISIGKLNLATSNFVRSNKIPEPKKNMEEIFKENEFEVFDSDSEGLVNSYEVRREEEKSDELLSEAERESENFYGEGKKSFYEESSLYSESRKGLDGEISVNPNDLRRVGEDFYNSGKDDKDKKKDGMGVIVPDGRDYFEGNGKQREYKIY